MSKNSKNKKSKKMKKVKKTDKKSDSEKKARTIYTYVKIVGFCILVFTSVYLALMFAGLVPSIDEMIDAWREAAENFPGNSTGGYTLPMS